MARASLVLSILVASPGDVAEERDAVTEAINQWNSEHSRQTYPATGAALPRDVRSTPPRRELTCRPQAAGYGRSAI
jgi:hypothetical protein